MKISKRTITVFSILLATVLLTAFTLPESANNGNKLSSCGVKESKQTAVSSKKSDSTPLIHITKTPSQQPPQMVSLQIQERSMVIQTYTSPSGRKILFDFICKSRQHLRMRLTSARKDTILWRTDVKIGGYQRQVLQMEARETGQYNLQFIGPKGGQLQQLYILKSG